MLNAPGYLARIDPADHTALYHPGVSNPDAEADGGSTASRVKENEQRESVDPPLLNPPLTQS